MFAFEQKLAFAKHNLEREIKVTLLDKGLTQSELAKELNLSEPQVSRAIKGGVNPSDVATRQKIYDYLENN